MQRKHGPIKYTYEMHFFHLKNFIVFSFFFPFFFLIIHGFNFPCVFKAGDSFYLVLVEQQKSKKGITGVLLGIQILCVRCTLADVIWVRLSGSITDTFELIFIRYMQRVSLPRSSLPYVFTNVR